MHVKRVEILPAKSFTPPRLAAIGLFLEQQVKRRFATQGLSGGVSWPQKKIQDGRAILTGRTGFLLNSFFVIQQRGVNSPNRHRVQVGSVARYARVHQLGTRGKGGKLPTIVPKRAKALWIPLNDKAARFGPGGPGLKKGKDFIFLKKVDIPPRPMLPDSEQEIAGQHEFISDLIADTDRKAG